MILLFQIDEKHKLIDFREIKETQKDEDRQKEKM